MRIRLTRPLVMTKLKPLGKKGVKATRVKTVVLGVSQVVEVKRTFFGLPVFDVICKGKKREYMSPHYTVVPEWGN